MAFYRRRVKVCPAVTEVVMPPKPESGDRLAGWLEEQASGKKLRWLLAHADDGVIWGRVDDGRLITSEEVARGYPEAEAISPVLRWETLQQARLFGAGGEVYLWRDENGGWRARFIRDVREGERAHWEEAYNEPQLLWGSTDGATPLAHGFTLVREGVQGLAHVLPMSLPVDGAKVSLPRLVVRHYLSRSGVARVVASRLLDLGWEWV